MSGDERMDVLKGGSLGSVEKFFGMSTFIALYMLAFRLSCYKQKFQPVCRCLLKQVEIFVCYSSDM